MWQGILHTTWRILAGIKLGALPICHVSHILLITATSSYFGYYKYLPYKYTMLYTPCKGTWTVGHKSIAC